MALTNLIRCRDTETISTASTARHSIGTQTTSLTYGSSAKTTHPAPTEADSDASAAAGHQAAPDVDAGARGCTQSRDGGESSPRGGADRRPPPGGSRDLREDGARAADKHERHLGRPGLRILLR